VAGTGKLGGSFRFNLKKHRNAPAVFLIPLCLSYRGQPGFNNLLRHHLMLNFIGVWFKSLFAHSYKTV
jgi:hypothetical protein